MKTMVNHVLVKCASLIASLAMVVAVSSAASTCFFLSYQPDLPDELKE